jgi:hypothetical protein
MDSLKGVVEEFVKQIQTSEPLQEVLKLDLDWDEILPTVEEFNQYNYDVVYLLGVATVVIRALYEYCLEDEEFLDTPATDGLVVFGLFFALLMGVFDDIIDENAL